MMNDSPLNNVKYRVCNNTRPRDRPGREGLAARLPSPGNAARLPSPGNVHVDVIKALNHRRFLLSTYFLHNRYCLTELHIEEIRSPILE